MSLEAAKNKFKKLLSKDKTTDSDIALFLRDYNPVEMFVLAKDTRADRSLVTNKRLWDGIGREYLATTNKDSVKRTNRAYTDRYCLSLVIYMDSKPALFSTLNIYETHTKKLMFRISDVDTGKLWFQFLDTDGADRRKLVLLITTLLDKEIPGMFTLTSSTAVVKNILKRNVKIRILYRVMQLPNVSVECPIETQGGSGATVELVQEEFF